MQKTAVLGQRQGVILAATKMWIAVEETKYVTKNAYDFRIGLVPAEVGGKN